MAQDSPSERPLSSEERDAIGRRSIEAARRAMDPDVIAAQDMRERVGRESRKRADLALRSAGLGDRVDARLRAEAIGKKSVELAKKGMENYKSGQSPNAGPKL